MQVLDHSHEQKANKQKEPHKELRKKVKHATKLITIILYNKIVKKSNNE